MSKITYENYINIYKEKRNGESSINIGKKYGIDRCKVNYIYSLINKHGLDILRKEKNRYYTKEEKEKIIIRVLNGESIRSVALDEGLTSFGLLSTWVKNYKDMGYNIVERKRGRSPTMLKKAIKNVKETDKEKIKRLEQENLYLKAELEYSKKLRAVVQSRKNRQQKKK